MLQLFVKIINSTRELTACSITLCLSPTIKISFSLRLTLEINVVLRYDATSILPIISLLLLFIFSPFKT